jgi:prepilin-type N-terminal cleavage/methylation domain-containing protein
MSRFIKKQGFTLIELMVVIVIIGVLASLAIPRFTEASSKAKIAEAPRVLASYESAYLAAKAENAGTFGDTDLVFEKPTSKWFTYGVKVAGADSCWGIANKGDIGKFLNNSSLSTKYIPSAANAPADTFVHTSSLPGVAKKMVPNFCGASC